jgi:hypothetical protein
MAKQKPDEVPRAATPASPSPSNYVLIGAIVAATACAAAVLGVFLTSLRTDLRASEAAVRELSGRIAAAEAKLESYASILDETKKGVEDQRASWRNFAISSCSQWRGAFGSDGECKLPDGSSFLVPP